MANFFKNYQTELKAKREAEENAKPKRKEYQLGQVVYVGYISPLCGEVSKRMYFVTYLDDNTVILAKSKKAAMNEEGHIYYADTILRSGKTR
jgi:hypothetical protein